MKSLDKNNKVLGFFIILGGILGGIAGNILGNKFSMLSFLNSSYKIGTLAPINLDFKILQLTLGINLSVNIMSIIGVILAILLYRNK